MAGMATWVAGYKWTRRYKEGEQDIDPLRDRSRAALCCTGTTPLGDVVDLLMRVRKQRPPSDIILEDRQGRDGNVRLKGPNARGLRAARRILCLHVLRPAPSRRNLDLPCGFGCR
ncbi:MAG: hypothetical protein H6832_07490 [Planctomycetes bacterium]|nr:hypothetical protein [Planctomycetota bacterium]